MLSNSECYSLFYCNDPQILHRYPAHFPIDCKRKLKCDSELA